MRSMEFMLLQFHRSFGATINARPTIPSLKDRGMRHSLVTEEIGETQQALIDGNFPEFVDGLIDTLYVLVGTNITYGLVTVQPIYGAPSVPPAFPESGVRATLSGMLHSMLDVAKIALNTEWNPAASAMLPTIQLCMNKLISDCLVILHLCGVDTMHVFAEVHLANMRKLGPDGLPIKREDGKVMKPEGWQPPDIQRVLDEQVRRFDFPAPAQA